MDVSCGKETKEVGLLPREPQHSACSSATQTSAPLLLSAVADKLPVVQELPTPAKCWQEAALLACSATLEASFMWRAGGCQKAR